MRPLSSRSPGAPWGAQREGPWWRMAWPLAAITLLITLLGTVVYHYLSDDIWHEAQRTLTVIAEQKRQQIEAWLTQCRNDAELYFSEDALFATLYDQWLDGGWQHALLRARMQSRMEDVARVRGWKGLVVLDTDLRPVVTVGDTDFEEHEDEIREVLHHPEIKTLGLHRHGNGDGVVLYGVLAPIGTSGTAPHGVAMITWQADQTLYPLVGSWPIQTRSAETYLVQRDGDQIRFLSPLRFRSNAALNLTMPLTATDLSVARAVQGQFGLQVDVRDYRGVSVLAYTTTIAGTPWVMVAEIDQHEVRDGIRELAWATALSVGLGLLLINAAGYWLWRRRRRRQEQAAESRFRLMFEQAPLGVVLLESNADPVESQAGLIIEANQRFAAILGRALDDLVGRPWISLTHPDDVQAGLELLARLQASEIDHLQMRHRYLRPDDSVVWANLTLTPVVVEAGQPPRHLGMIEDITERIRLETALITSEHRYQLALDATREALWDADLSTGAMVVNDRASILLGYVPGEIVHSFDLWMSHIHPDDVAAVQRANEEYLSGRAPLLDVDYRILTSSGELRWLRTVGQIVARDSDGSPRRIIGTSEDITDKVRAQTAIKEGLQRLQLATVAADIGVWSWDMTNGRLEWDERVCNWYEVPESMRGTALYADLWRSRVHPADLARCERNLAAAIRDRTTYEDAFRIVLPGGRIRYLESTALIEQDAAGKLLRIFGVNRDITRQHAQEEELRLAKQAAEQANAAKSEFLAHMSHEIRTPLNGVLGLTQVLARESLTDNQRDLVGRIRTAGQSLLAILNDILDFSKIEAGQLRLDSRPFDLTALIARIGNLMEQTAHAKGLALRIETPVAALGSLLGDELRLGQVLLNLIGNAIKFTEQGEVVLRVQTLRADEGSVRLHFAVQDTGIGIAPAVLAGLFTPFSQAHTGIARRYGGTGLGLSICKHLVGQMGGEIQAESIPDQGSLFRFELSFERDTRCIPEAVATPAPPAPTGPRLAGAHLLVVDDSAMNREVVERALALEGATATLAADGQQALQFLTNSPAAFAAVLMDIQMPVMDGLTATRAIRGTLGLRELPIIALTAGVLPEQQAAALAAGVDAVLTKPLDLDQMVARLSPWVAHWVTQRPAAAIQPVVPIPPETGSETGSEAGLEVGQQTGPDGPGELPYIAGIDRGRATLALGGDRAFFIRLLQRFIDDFATVADLTRQDLAADDQASAARRMHSLRGTAGYLGAQDLKVAAGELEEAILAGATGLEPRLAALGDQLTALISTSAPWLAEPAEAVPIAIAGGCGEQAQTAPLDPTRLEALCEALRQNNAKARRLFRELEPSLRPVLGDEATHALGQALRDLHFDTALTLLQGLALEGADAHPQGETIP